MVGVKTTAQGWPENFFAPKEHQNQNPIDELLANLEGQKKPKKEPGNNNHDCW